MQAKYYPHQKKKNEKNKDLCKFVYECNINDTMMFILMHAKYIQIYTNIGYAKNYNVSLYFVADL